MKEDCRIYIPSREREDFIAHSRGVWRYLNDLSTEIPCPVSVVVRGEEAEKYMEALRVSGNTKINLLLVDNDRDIAGKRQAMLEDAINLRVDRMIIVDDDVTFSVRDESLSSKYLSRIETCLEMKIFQKIIREVVSLCNENTPIVGLPLRQGSVGLKYLFPYNIPVIRFVCYDVHTLIKENIQVNGLGTTFMSDRYVHLSLLEKGYKSISNCRYAIDDMGTGYRGGCSITRTSDKQSEAARALQKRFPNFVELKTKTDGYWEEQRIDCTIHWRKFITGGLRYLPMEEGLKRIME